MKMFSIVMRSRVLVNTDPQRRCYDGAHFSSELVWTNWTLLDSDVREDKAESKLKFWRDLNDYAVRERGVSAKNEYKLQEQQTTGEQK